MLPLLLVCLIGSTLAQSTTTQGSTSQVESEDVNTQPYLYPIERSYNTLQPAAQQQRPVYRQPETYSYMPYSFNYLAQGEDGSSSREETGDSSGRVVGSYTIRVDDGRQRQVNYIADQNGFRATIDTNEPGTDTQSPADVAFYSSAPTARSPQTSYRPTNAYRPRPSSLYNSQPSLQPIVAHPSYYRAPAYAPYRHYDNHAYDRHNYNGHAYASYHDNAHRYYYR